MIQRIKLDKGQGSKGLEVFSNWDKQVKARAWPSQGSRKKNFPLGGWRGGAKRTSG